MLKLTLPKSYGWQGVTYGPGEAEVPEDLAKAIAADLKQQEAENQEDSEQAPPTKLPEEQLDKRKLGKLPPAKDATAKPVE